MNWKKTSSYIFISVLFAIWLISILAVYIPTLSWGIPTFPVKIDPTLKTVFLISTVGLTLSSFLMGMEELGLLSRISNLFGHHTKND
jgi:hypothetical protein